MGSTKSSVQENRSIDVGMCRFMAIPNTILMCTKTKALKYLVALHCRTSKLCQSSWVFSCKAAQVTQCSHPFRAVCCRQTEDILDILFVASKFSTQKKPRDHAGFMNLNLMEGIQSIRLKVRLLRGFIQFATFALFFRFTYMSA